MNLNYALIVSSPILASYGIGVSSISVFDIVLLFVLGGLFLDKLRRRDFGYRCQAGLLPYFYCYFIFSIALLHSILVFEGGEPESLVRTARFLVYYIVAFIIFSSISDFTTFTKYLTFAALFVSVFLLTQYILLFFTGFVLKGYLTVPQLPLLRPEVIDHAESITRLKSGVRLRSVLGEPSQIGLFVGLALFIRTYSLSSFFNLINLILVTALILSFSTTAYLFIAISLFYHVLASARSSYAVGLLFLLFICIGTLTLSIIDLNDTRIVKSLLNRVARDIDLDGASVVNVLFGLGYGESVLEVWRPSIQRIFLSFGVFGVLIFLYSVAILLDFRSFTSLFFGVCYLTLSLGSEVALSFFNVLYILTLLYIKKNCRMSIDAGSQSGRDMRKIATSWFGARDSEARSGY
ncbi:hypothetical protein OAT60_01335 [Luminiphilus sp.]|nr:hypothetical protein [Luminiphilus sp.]